MRQRFDFYGLHVDVVTTDEPTGESVRRDWKYFDRAEETAAALEIRLQRTPPPFDSVPDLRASLITPRNVCFRGDGVDYLDYFGRGLAVINRESATVDAYAEDPHLLREITYLFLLSTVGQHVDTLGRHRIHALGLNFRGHGLLLMLPSGGGKSTMALQLLQRTDIRMLSEDTPLVDARGMLYPFPLRLGIRPGNEPPSIPTRHMETVRRMEFGPKTLIDLDYFDAPVSEPCPARALLVGARSSGRDASIEPIPRRQAWRDLVSNLVVGVGVYQGIEFVLQSSWLELSRKAPQGFARLRAGRQLLRRAQPYRFVLGRDSDKNLRCLESFLESELGS
jgi:hypothetical protein